MKTKKKSVKFTVDYFIKKFKAIPRYHWMCGEFQSRSNRVVLACALGHCGIQDADQVDNNPEAKALGELFRTKLGVNVVYVNDRQDKEPFHKPGTALLLESARVVIYTNKGKHPRTRILNALKTIKEKT